MDASVSARGQTRTPRFGELQRWLGGARSISQDFTANNEMLFTPNFLLAPLAFSEMN